MGQRTGCVGLWRIGRPHLTGNSYAVCDIGFELSFAAVLGTLAGAELSRHLHALFAAHATRKKKPSVLQRILRHVRSSLTETVCIGVCASAAAFPVLVLRGLSVSIYAVLSGVAVLWMVKPMMLLGLGTAFAGLVPAAGPLYTMIGKAAEFLTGLLNRWAVWVSAKPGAGLYFDTNYAAIVCLLLMALCGLAHVWKVRLRVAVPGLLLTAVLAIGVGNALCRDVVHVDLVGSANSPAVVVSQNHTAVVLFRGGASTQRAVENQLSRRGVTRWNCWQICVWTRKMPARCLPGRCAEWQCSRWEAPSPDRRRPQRWRPCVPGPAALCG